MAIYTGDQARSALLRGAEKLYKVCEKIIGPSAKVVAFSTGQFLPFVTSDGVTAVREIILPDHLENIGADLIRAASQQTNDTSGDGTTTTVILAYSLFKGAACALSAGVDPFKLSRCLEDIANKAVADMRKFVVNLETEEQISAVASLSADDTKIGKLIAEAISKIGKDGLFTAEESYKGETTLEVESGTIAEGGWFIPEYGGTESEIMVENAYLLMTDDTIEEPESLTNLLKTIKAQKRALVTLSGGIHSRVMATFRANRKNGFPLYCAKAPLFGDRRKDFLEDLATLTGGVVFSRSNGIPYKQATLELLGRAASVRLRPDKTIVYGGAGSEERVLERVRGIRREIATAPSSYDREKLQERLARLTGGIAVIKLGGSELDKRLSKFRVEDAVRATQSAMEEGIVPGGGVCLLRVANSMVDDGSAESRWAADILRKAFSSPFKLIMANDVEDPAILARQVISASSSQIVFNAKTRKLENCLVSGILDPFKVIRTAVEHSLSLVKVLITSGTVVLKPVHEVNVVSKGYRGKRPGKYFSAL